MENIYIFDTGKDYHCSTIEYFPNEEYSPDPNDSTMAIPCKLKKRDNIFCNFIIF